MTDTERLKRLWDGKSAYVDDGGTTYRVVTPNGKADPVFIPISDASLYNSTSMTAPEPRKAKPTLPAKPANKKITKNTDVT